VWPLIVCPLDDVRQIAEASSSRPLTIMAVDIRPIQRALRALRATVPLKEGEADYVKRPDGLGQKILERIMNPISHRLLLAGPAGCGKTTELQQLFRLTHPNYAVFLCPCDRDLDLYRFNRALLVRYLLWRIVFVASQPQTPIKLSQEIVRDVLQVIGTNDVRLDEPRLFFSEVKPPPSSSSIHITLQRLLAEVDNPLLLIDGLEKIPTDAADPLREFIRSPELNACQAVVIVPNWALLGWDGVRTYEDVEILEIAVPAVPDFVRAVLFRRVGEVFAPAALDLAAEWSGGVLRDGLQLAGLACRRAMDDRSPTVAPIHVQAAIHALRDAFRSMLSDDPVRVGQFLEEVRRSSRLPGNPVLRDRLLGNGIVLPNEDGSFRVHPCVD
jgi:hypothetical protein